MNLFAGFRDFHEKTDYVGTIKKQAHVPKKLWMGMPVVLSNVRIGEDTIRDPRVFYVTDFDSETVTIKNVKNPMDWADDDPDQEVDLDKDDWAQKTFTIPRSAFYRLLEPPGQGDYATASGAVQWRQGI